MSIRYKWLLMATCLLTLMFGISCTDNTGDDDRDPCEKADDKKRNAIEDYCEDFETICCYCHCYNQHKRYDYDDGKCTCVEPEDGDDEDICEGPSLKDAENCLDDLESCIDNALSVAQSGCSMSLL